MRALAEWSRVERKARDPRPWYSDCFDQQRGILDAGNEWEAILCTRRAGKTHALGARAIQSLLANPKLPVLYITLTQEHSMGNLANYLTTANKTWDLGLKWRDNKLVHPRGGYIWLAGCKDKREAEKFRGYKFSDVTIDEGGTHRDEVLKWLIYDVLSAALTDMGAPLRISGTPGPVPTGLFWALSTNEDPETPGWHTRSWSLFDNPHHAWHRNPDLARIYRETRLRIPESHPTWVREFLGKWCLDTTALIYHCARERNYFDAMPTGFYRTTLGVDVGYEDETAFVVCSSQWGQPTVYVRHAHGENHMLPSAIAAEIKKLVAQYGVQEIYMDAGGLAKTILVQMQQDYGLGVEPAEKHDKVGAIERVRDGLQRGEILVDPVNAKPLLDEWNVLVWDTKDGQRTKKGHRERMPDHNSDALLYAYRPHLHQRPPIKPPELTLEERLRQEQARSKARLAMGKRR